MSFVVVETTSSDAAVAEGRNADEEKDGEEGEDNGKDMFGVS